jgi:hypothetical protein
MSLNPEHTIAQVKRTVESEKRSEIRLNANGGNSILVVCPPDREFEFIKVIKKEMNTDNYSVIDLNELLISFIEQNRAYIIDSFELLKGSVHQVFRAPVEEEGPDFYSHILSAIQATFSAGKIPVLIHAGALNGSGIENIHLMESELVMKSNIPMIILYPAIHDGDQLMFLNTRPASKYRCMIVN